MNFSAKWLNDIRMFCPKCNKSQQVILIIGSDPESGNMKELNGDCHLCKTRLMRWTDDNNSNV